MPSSIRGKAEYRRKALVENGLSTKRVSRDQLNIKPGFRLFSQRAIWAASKLTACRNEYSCYSPVDSGRLEVTLRCAAFPVFFQ